MSRLTQVRLKRNKIAKGDRLKWTPIAEVKSVDLRGINIVGKIVHTQITIKSPNNNDSNFLIP